MFSIKGGNLMETEFSSKEKDKIYKGIRKKYKKVAKKPDGLFKYPTGKAGQVVVDPSTGTRTRILRNDVSGYQEPVSANQIDNFQLDNLTNFANGRLIDELKE